MATTSVLEQDLSPEQQTALVKVRMLLVGYYKVFRLYPVYRGILNCFLRRDTYLGSVHVPVGVAYIGTCLTAATCTERPPL